MAAAQVSCENLQIHWNEFGFPELVLSVKKAWREVDSLE